MNEGDDRRADAERRQATYKAWLISKDGVRQEVTTLFLTREGCVVRGAKVTVGDRVDLLVTGHGCFAAEIRWIADERAGVRFVR